MGEQWGGTEEGREGTKVEQQHSRGTSLDCQAQTTRAEGPPLPSSQICPLRHAGGQTPRGQRSRRDLSAAMGNERGSGSRVQPGGHPEQLLVSWGSGRIRDLPGVMRWVLAGARGLREGEPFPAHKFLPARCQLVHRQEPGPGPSQGQPRPQACPGHPGCAGQSAPDLTAHSSPWSTSLPHPMAFSSAPWSRA